MQIGQHRLEKYSKVSTMYCWDEENTYVFLRLYYMYNLVQLRTNITLKVKEIDLNKLYVLWGFPSPDVLTYMLFYTNTTF